MEYRNITFQNQLRNISFFHLHSLRSIYQMTIMFRCCIFKDSILYQRMYVRVCTHKTRTDFSVGLKNSIARFASFNSNDRFHLFSKCVFSFKMEKEFLSILYFEDAHNLFDVFFQCPFMEFGFMIRKNAKELQNL